MMAGKWILPCALAALGHFILLGSITTRAALSHTLLGWSCAWSGAGLCDPCGAFCDSLIQVMLKAAGPAGIGSILQPAAGAKTGAKGFVN